MKSSPAGFDVQTAPADFERRVTTTFAAIKQGPFGSNILAGSASAVGIELVPFTLDRAEDTETIRLLAEWRQASIAGFTKVFHVSNEGTGQWARSQLIERGDRILFFVREKQGPFVGHIGLSSFDFGEWTFELDNVVRGELSAPKGIMQAASCVLLDWSYAKLEPRHVEVRVLHDNTRALALYHRLGFRPFALQPLKRVEGRDFVEWVSAAPGDRFDRFMVAMRHVRA